VIRSGAALTPQQPLTICRYQRWSAAQCVIRRHRPKRLVQENPMPSADTHIVSDADFKRIVLDSTEPVLVDFFAEWCGPCKAMAPALEQVASEMKGKIKVAKIDVDHNPATTVAYHVQAMPTLMIFKGGKVAAQHVGALVQKSKLEAWIKASI
jgi:thioredoxin 1